MAREILDLEQLMNNPNAKIRIALPSGAGGGVVSGFTQENFSIAGAASFEGKQVGQFDQFDKVGNLGSMIYNSATGGSIENFTTLSRPATNRRWTSSDPVQFPVNFTIVAYRENIDVRQDAARLFRCVYPNGSVEEILGFDVAMRAPMGYNYTINTATNTISLSIGQWFEADGLLMDDVMVEFSKEVIASGAPLYANVSVTLSPWRMSYADDIEGYLTGGGGGASLSGLISNLF